MSTTVAVAGDWHGDTQWGMKVINLMRGWKADTLIHLGDFGIWPGPDGARYLDVLNRTAQLAGVTVLVVPGNHEDYDQINALVPNEDGLLPIRDSILLLPRGHTFTIAGFSFLAFGGATSIDRNLRKAGRSWWSDEIITEADVEAAKRSVDENGHPDFIVSHEAPAGVDFQYSSARPSWFTPEIFYEVNQSRRYVRDVMDYAKPTWLIHGHHHRTHAVVIDGMGFDYQPYETRVLGLSNERQPGNVILLALDRDGDPMVKGRFPFGSIKKDVMRTFNSHVTPPMLPEASRSGDA